MLLDFGALASFGPAHDIVGTPTHIPPEAMLRGVIDQRLDLYALGATAYFALTGRAAYPAKSVHQLPELWRTTKPLPVSALVPDVPEELSALVMSLLCLEATARPASAAEVIDRLNACAHRVWSREKPHRSSSKSSSVAC
jgi:serine/threonine protein kinase